MPFEVRDVSVDQSAAREMVQRTRQMGVPVIADEQEAIVGFDLPRLQRMAARHRRGPGLGLKVADAKDGPGAYVGGVREGSPGKRAGLQIGDTIIELSGRPVACVCRPGANRRQTSARPTDEHDRPPRRRDADAHTSLRFATLSVCSPYEVSRAQPEIGNGENLIER